MNCSNCGNESNKVLDSKIICYGKMIKRRRQCHKCHHRWTTIEQEAATAEEVVKQAHRITKAFEVMARALGYK